MVFRRRSRLVPIVSRKAVVDDSGVVPGNTSTVIFSASANCLAQGVAAADITNVQEVTAGSKIFGFYLSLFAAYDTNQPAAAVPLIDWYIIYDKGNSMGTAFTATGLPVPGATGTHNNKSKIIHEEKGLGGEKNDGYAMIFKGVVRVPRGMQRIGFEDRLRVVMRSNDDIVYCAKAIYKWYS